MWQWDWSAYTTQENKVAIPEVVDILTYKRCTKYVVIGQLELKEKLNVSYALNTGQNFDLNADMRAG